MANWKSQPMQMNVYKEIARALAICLHSTTLFHWLHLHTIWFELKGNKTQIKQLFLKHLWKFIQFSMV